MAKGAAESGAVESYMCNKIKRNPVVASRCAAYLGEFEAEEGANGIQKDTQWLVRWWLRCASRTLLLFYVCVCCCCGDWGAFERIESLQFKGSSCGV
jgi:hypothetical protein